MCVQFIISAWVSCSCLYWIAFDYFRHASYLSRLFWMLLLSSKTLACFPEPCVIRIYSLFQYPWYSYWRFSMASSDFWSRPPKRVNRTAKEKNMVSEVSVSVGKKTQAEKNQSKPIYGLCCMKMCVWIVLSSNKMIFINSDLFFVCFHS